MTCPGSDGGNLVGTKISNIPAMVGASREKIPALAGEGDHFAKVFASPFFMGIITINARIKNRVVK